MDSDDSTGKLRHTQTGCVYNMTHGGRNTRAQLVANGNKVHFVAGTQKSFGYCDMIITTTGTVACTRKVR